eukprot:4763910-Pleurochrysis_carterae.AAC.3
MACMAIVGARGRRLGEDEEEVLATKRERASSKERAGTTRKRASTATRKLTEQLEAGGYSARPVLAYRKPQRLRQCGAALKIVDASVFRESKAQWNPKPIGRVCKHLSCAHCFNAAARACAAAAARTVLVLLLPLGPREESPLEAHVLDAADEGLLRQRPSTPKLEATRQRSLYLAFCRQTQTEDAQCGLRRCEPARSTR